MSLPNSFETMLLDLRDNDDHQRRVAPFRSVEPSRDHIHTVIRTPNGNDYGKDLLRQHYEHHGSDHKHAE